MTAPRLELVDVARSFSVSAGLFRGKRSLRAVDGVSLRLERGRTLGLVGESGCGKSTLAKMILGLLPPSQGEVRVDGRPVNDLDAKERARLIQPIFQDPYSSLNPRRTIEELVAQPLQVHGEGTRADRLRRAREALSLVRLPRRVFGAYPNQLSGGQRQRVAIARALILRPAIVVCDEPTSALDVSVQAQILNILMDLREELDLSYLFVSHNLAVVEHLADEVAVMYVGRVVEQAPTSEIFGRPRHPYTQALLQSVLTPDPRLVVPEIALGAGFPNPLDPPPGCAFHPRCPQAFAPCSRARPRDLSLGAGARVACHLHDGELCDATARRATA
ncbi:ABC transporter ATP-binding protein [Phormidium willei BDU 130791]|nr:ABC transporter ATP-binding protein [Phormidium willei BDU 130791]